MGSDLLIIFIAPYIFMGAFVNAFIHDARVLWGRWSYDAPTKDASAFIWITCGSAWVPVILLYGAFRFLKGGVDLLPKRKAKLPEARIHHG